jgi:hypothetical protein
MSKNAMRKLAEVEDNPGRNPSFWFVLARRESKS